MIPSSLSHIYSGHSQPSLLIPYRRQGGIILVQVDPGGIRRAGPSGNRVQAGCGVTGDMMAAWLLFRVGVDIARQEIRKTDITLPCLHFCRRHAHAHIHSV